MKTWIKYALVTVILGAIAMMLGPKLWPPIADPMPSAQQLPFFIILAGIQALVFGFGIAFLVFNWSAVMKKKDSLTCWAFFALIWTLVSWWPHDNLHMHNGLNFQGLLYIDYGFHLTLMIAGLILAKYFWRTIQK
jgi:hypothetical protein